MCVPRGRRQRSGKRDCHRLPGCCRVSRVSVFFGCCAAGQVDGESDDEQESAGTGEEEDGDESDLVSSMRSDSCGQPRAAGGWVAQPLTRRRPLCGTVWEPGPRGGGRWADLVPALGPDQEGEGPAGVGLGLGGCRTWCVRVDRPAARTVALCAEVRGGA